MSIQRLLYRSDIALPGTSENVEAQVAGIVADAAAANAAVGVTGALLLSAGVFVQALEGPSDVVETTFERICRDLRHRHVRLLEIAAAEDRVFGEWSMVQVRSPIDIARLCPGFELPRQARLDMSAAGAIVRSMRTVLLTNAASARDAVRFVG